MKKFGIVSEGVTDYATLENILCGYCSDWDDDDITPFQPLDETDSKKAQSYGGWGPLVQYLKSRSIYADIKNVEYLIIQIDTDISNESTFNIPHQDKEGNKLSGNELANIMKNRLIEIIKEAEKDNYNVGFYEENASKFIYAICVHSLECWLYTFYDCKRNKKKQKDGIKQKINSCGGALDTLFEEGDIDFLLEDRNFKKLNFKKEDFKKGSSCFTDNKKQKIYQTYSQPFLESANITTVAAKNESFNHFIQQLQPITISTSAPS